MPSRAELLRRPVATLDEAKQWIVDLYDLDLVFHFEDDPATIGNQVRGKWVNTFRPTELSAVNKRIEELYALDWTGAGGCPIGWALAVMTAPKARIEFPDYDITSLPFGAGNFEDSSWKNDACPSFKDEKLGLLFFADYPKPEDREFPDAPRFTLYRLDEDGCFQCESVPLAESEDFQVIERAIQEARKVPA